MSQASLFLRAERLEALDLEDYRTLEKEILIAHPDTHRTMCRVSFRAWCNRQKFSEKYTRDLLHIFGLDRTGAIVDDRQLRLDFETMEKE